MEWRCGGFHELSACPISLGAFRIWVPAFAGMSGGKGRMIEHLPHLHRRPRPPPAPRRRRAAGRGLLRRRRQPGPADPDPGLGPRPWPRRGQPDRRPPAQSRQRRLDRRRGRQGPVRWAPQAHALAWTGPKPPPACRPPPAPPATPCWPTPPARPGRASCCWATPPTTWPRPPLMRAEGSTVSDPRDWSPSPAWPEGRGVFVLRPLLAVGRGEIRDWLKRRGARPGWTIRPTRTRGRRGPGRGSELSYNRKRLSDPGGGGRRSRRRGRPAPRRPLRPGLRYATSGMTRGSRLSRPPPHRPRRPRRRRLPVRRRHVAAAARRAAPAAGRAYPGRRGLHRHPGRGADRGGGGDRCPSSANPARPASRSSPHRGDWGA
jgi:hypothetical protein